MLAPCETDTWRERPWTSSPASLCHSDSPLWSEPRLLMTAHVAGNSLLYEERATDLFLENLRRYLDGRDLLNVYDPDRGY